MNILLDHRIFNHLGDHLIYTHLIAYLRKQHPNDSIDLIINKDVYVNLFTNNPYVDRVLIIPPTYPFDTSRYDKVYYLNVMKTNTNRMALNLSADSMHDIFIWNAQAAGIFDEAAYRNVEIFLYPTDADVVAAQQFMESQKLQSQGFITVNPVEFSLSNRNNDVSTFMYAVQCYAQQYDKQIVVGMKDPEQRSYLDKKIRQQLSVNMDNLVYAFLPIGSWKALVDNAFTHITTSNGGFYIGLASRVPQIVVAHPESGCWIHDCDFKKQHDGALQVFEKASYMPHYAKPLGEKIGVCASGTKRRRC